MPWYNAVDHTYWDGDRRLLSTTEILDLAGFVDKRFFNETSRQKGTDLHEASILVEDGDLCWEDAWALGIEGECRALQRFFQETKFVSIQRETPLFELIRGFAGTPDRLGRLVYKNRAYSTIIDFKTGQPAPWHPIQLAGYDVLVPGELLPFPRRRICVYLSPEGTYTMVPHSDSNDRITFLGALIVAQWKIDNLQNGGKA